MDFLKAEIAKRKAEDGPSGSNGKDHSTTKEAEQPPAKKYMRKGDLDRIRREQEEREELEAVAKRKEIRQKKIFEGAKKVAEAEAEAAPSAHGQTTSHDPERAHTAKDGNGIKKGKQAQTVSSDAVSKPEVFNISNAEAIRRLRAKDQPIRLFGESDKERRLRLRAVELIEERSEGQRNDFMRALEGMDKGLDLEELQRRAGTPSNPALIRLKEGSATPMSGDESDTPHASESEEPSSLAIRREDEPVDLTLVKKNPSKVYPQIYFGMKSVLKEWEESMAERPDAVKRSTQGKLAAATQKQSAEYLKPLFKAIRKRDLAPDVLLAVAEIVHFMQKREYLRANDSYLRLSIGNAPWPIGVTMVGIHERSAREKIHSNSVAHVLNDEVSRKYIQSLKRLLTFAQTKRPPDDLSQMMG